MTVIRPNSVAGINSITVQSGNSLAVHKANGELIRTITANSGVSTFSSISVGTATTDNSAAKSINIGLGASISQHVDNSLSFGTGGDERARLDANGRVLIGTTTEGHSNADDLTIATSANTGITIRSGTSNGGNIFFSDATSGTGEYAGMISYDHNDNIMTFHTNEGNERLRINSNGTIGINTTAETRQLEIFNSSHATAALKSDTQSSLFFSDSADTNIGQISYMHSSNYMYFRVNDQERLRIDSSGRLLYGVTSSTRETSLILQGNSNSYTTNPGVLELRVGQVPSSQASLGSLVFGCTGDKIGGTINAIADNADWSSGSSHPTALRFYTTAASSTTQVERLRIAANGDVKVTSRGSNNSGAPLYVAVTGKSSVDYGGGNDDTACLRIVDNGSTNSYYHGIELRCKRDGDARIYAQDMGSDACDLVFATDNSGLAERLRIASDGNIHINTTDNGTANAKLNIEDSSSVGVNQLKLINKPSGSNGKARLEFYAESSGGQGATAYIRSTSGTDADGANDANDAGLEFHTSQGGSGTDVTALKIDNSGKTRISTHEGNDALHITPLASASTSIVINTWPDNSNGRNWAIRNRYNEHGRLEFMRGTSNSDSPLTPVFVLNRDSSCSFSGSLSKASGSFKIDHPLPSKTNTHHLVHSFIEGPQADLIYRGKVDLVGGTSTVNIDTVAGMSDGTFVLLNREVQCFTSNETGWTAVKGSVSGNVLTITAQDNSCTDTISWMVVGERKDPHMYDTEWTDADGKVILEPLKETEVSLGGG